MARGSKAAYGDEQQGRAEHIEAGYDQRAVDEGEAARTRARRRKSA